MNEYLLIYRADPEKMTKGSPEEMQARVKPWMDWIGGIAAQNKLGSMGNRLFSAGKVVKPGNVIADGPFMEIKEAIVGYSIVKASSLDDAALLAQGCPIHSIGGNVEVREISVIPG
jgi:hypothetical protein